MLAIIIIVPIFRIRKLKLREIKLLTIIQLIKGRAKI